MKNGMKPLIERLVPYIIEANMPVCRSKIKTFLKSKTIHTIAEFKNVYFPIPNNMPAFIEQYRAYIGRLK